MLSGIANYFFGGSNEETQESNVSTGENSNETTTRSRTDSPTRAGCNLKISAADEEWLLVDKTTRCTTTQSMEVGSMENLLIEHPSMSVYGPRGRQGSSGVESDRESMSDIEEESTTTRPRPDHRVQAHRPTRRSGRALSLRDAQSPEKVNAQAAQVAQRKINRHNNRSQLKMQNKLASFRNNSKSYRQHLHQPSSRKQTTPSRH